MANPSPSIPPSSTPAPTKFPTTLLSALHELNEEVVYVLATNEIAELTAPDGEVSLRYMSPHTFKTAAYSDRSISFKGKRLYLANEWMKWPGRRKVNKTVYEPGQSRITKDGNLNTWFPSPNLPIKGDLTLWHKYIDHMFSCDPTFKDWFLAWLAYPIQHPGTKLHTASAFYSSMTGTGKSTLSYIMREIYGTHNCSTLNEGDLDDKYNAWAVGKCFIEVDEMRGGSMAKKRAEKLKSAMTRSNMGVELKYQNRYEIRDTLNYYFTTNHLESLHLDSTDRRFFIHDVGNTKLSEHFFRKELGPWLRSGGFSAIHYYLLNEVDLAKPIVGGDPYSPSPSPFSPGAAAPHTRTRLAMIEASLDDSEAWIEDFLMQSKEKVPSILTLDDLYNQYFAERKKSAESYRTFTAAVSKRLTPLYRGNAVTLLNGKRKRLYSTDKDARETFTQEELSHEHSHEMEKMCES